MKLISTTVEEFGPYAHKTIEWGSEEGLIFFTAPNGTGKTFLLEGAFAALYGDFPSYKGTIFDAVRQSGPGKATVVLVFEYKGKRYRVTRKVNVTPKTRKQDAVIEIDGTDEALAGPKIRDFDEYILNLLGDPDLALATWFSSYRSSGDLCELTPAKRSDLISEFIKTTHLGAISSRAKTAKTKADTESDLHRQRVRDFDTERLVEPDESTKSIEKELSTTGSVLVGRKAEHQTIVDDMARMADRVEDANRAGAYQRDLETRASTVQRLDSNITRLAEYVRDKEKLESEAAVLTETNLRGERVGKAREYRLETGNLEQRAAVAEAAIEASAEQLKLRHKAAEKAAREHRENNPYFDLSEAELDDVETYAAAERQHTEVQTKLTIMTATEKEIATNRSLLEEANRALEAFKKDEPEVFDFETILREHRELSGTQKALASSIEDLEAHRKNLSESVGQISTRIALRKQRAEEAGKSRDEIVRLSRRTQDLEIIEKAFGRSGVQALLIEHAIKPFEMMASEMMQAATEGRFDVRFETLKENQDGSFAEQISIIIADADGERDIYQFSGGERRIFSTIIRLALSRWIAQRSGHVYGTICVDEAFDSLDPANVELLTEMFSNVAPFFNNIVLVTPNPAYVSQAAKRIVLD